MMELYEEILSKKQTEAGDLSPCPYLRNLSLQMVELESYQALKRIKAILEDESLDDPECFTRIEEILCVLEDLGSNGGNRHDFG